VPRRTHPTIAWTSPSIWKVFGAVVLGAQFVWLLVVSIHLHQRFSLTSDFALFFQAWHAIAGGNLSPTTTIYRTGPFLDNHFELLIYPLALFEYIDPSGLILLILQDLATVLAEFVAFLWILDLLEEHWPHPGRSMTAITMGALVVLAVDPWIWWASAFDFHLEIFATLFALLAARNFWYHRWLSGWIWSALTLLCGTVESIVLIGVGLSMVLANRKIWREGLGLVAAVGAWVVALNAAGFDTGSQLSSNYAYLTGASPGAQVHTTQVIAAVLRHPHRVATVLVDKRTHLWRILGGAGFIGIASTIGFPMTLVILIPAALNGQGSVLEPEASFQVLPVLLFLPVGAVALLCWFGHRQTPWLSLLGLGLGAAAVVQSIVLALIWVPRSQPYFARTDAEAAGVLNTILARTPADAQVIASNGFVGRFAARPWIYAFEKPTTAVGTVPVKSPTVEFIFSVSQGLQTSVPSATAAAIVQIQHRLHAQRIARSHGIVAYVWHPPTGVHTVSLPGL
jgi:hypothetical protein